ncbi:MAG: FG-GAP-like repeat-containing protein [Bacteroidia bacterium]
MADYDQDGDLDLMFTSFDSMGVAFGRLYRNDSSSVNSPPSLPTALSVSANCNVLEISWNQANDNESPSHNLTYAIKVGTSIGGNDIYPGLALPNGNRLLTGEGNNGSHTSIRIPVSVSGQYYVGLQTIDNGYAASGFLIDSIDVVIVLDSQLVISELSAQWPYANGKSTQTVLFDLDENGFPDIFMKTRRGSLNPSIDSTWVMYNDGSDFSLQTLLEHEEIGYFRDFDDYNGDGLPDLLYDINFTPLVGDSDSLILYPNLGNGTFGTPVKQALPGLESISYHPIDFNNDGNKDLLTSEQNLVSKPLKILYYDDTRTLVRTLELDSSVYTSAFYYFNKRNRYDLNSDGYADLLVGKYDSVEFSFFRKQPRVYINDQQGGFSLYNPVQPDTALMYSHLLFSPGDLDSDGDQDLVASYYRRPPGSQFGQMIYKLLRNDGNLIFTPVDLASIEDSSVLLSGYHTIGDYDSDGDLDIFTSENSLSGGLHLIENFGNFVFHERKICLDDITGISNLVDLDGDYDLDAIKGDRYGSNKLYKIISHPSTPNTPPAAPTNLGATYRVNDSVLMLSWSPAIDDKTPSPGLSYNLRIGSASGVADIIHPLSIINPGNPMDGRRLYFEIGNAFQQTAWNFHNIEIGKDYYWSVQAIDHSMAGSAFGMEHIAASNRSNGNGSVAGAMGTGEPEERPGSRKNSGFDAPIPDAWIALVSDVDNDTLLVDRTDSLGNFDFLNLEIGDYRIVANYMGLPMSPDNPVLSLPSGNESFEVTVLAGRRIYSRGY